MVDFNKHLHKVGKPVENSEEIEEKVLWGDEGDDGSDEKDENEGNGEGKVEEKPEPLRLADLPLISVLPADQFREAKELFKELESISDTEDHLKERKKKIQARLDVMQSGKGLRGMKWGSLVYAAVPMRGRRTIDKGKLILLGIKADIIAKAYKLGKSYVTHTFEDLEKPKKKKEWEEDRDGG